MGDLRTFAPASRLEALVVLIRDWRRRPPRGGREGWAAARVRWSTPLVDSDPPVLATSGSCRLDEF
jgi:hypothetical protein